MNIKVKVKKLREDAVLPRYACEGDAGMDLCALDSCVVGVKENFGDENSDFVEDSAKHFCNIWKFGSEDEKTKLITFYNHEVVGTKQSIIIANRLKLSNNQKEKLIRLVQYHQFTVSEEITDKAVRRFIREVGKEYLQDMLDLRTGDRIGSGATPTSWRFELFKKRIILFYLLICSTIYPRIIFG